MTAQPVIHAHKRPPKGLERAGRKLWRSVTAAYVLRPDELFVLESACRCADLVAQLEVAMRDQPLVVKGSMGQEREHPLLSEQRQQRALMNRSLAQLKLPDGTSGAQINQHREAALSRWAASRKGARA
jgi:hypothetical protein